MRAGLNFVERLMGRRAEVVEAAPPPAAPAADLGDIGLRDTIMSGWLNRQTQELAPGFAVSEQDVVVDVGAGDGSWAGFCAQWAAETIIVDHDPKSLENAVQRVRAQGSGRVSGKVSDASSLPLPDRVATRVICTEVLEHVDDPAGVMAELVRIGRPGALYLLSVPGAASERLQTNVAAASYFQKPNHIRVFDPDEFTRLVEDAGLVIEQRSSHGFFWSMWWLFFWQAGVEFGEGSHPLLDAWTRTWAEVLASSDAVKIKSALDALAPKVNALVARKPG